MNLNPQEQAIIGQKLNARIQTGVTSSPHAAGRMYATRLAQDQAFTSQVYTLALLLYSYYRIAQPGQDTSTIAVEDAYQYNFAVLAQSTQGWPEQLGPNGFQVIQECIARVNQRMREATAFNQSPQAMMTPQAPMGYPQQPQSFGVPGFTQAPQATLFQSPHPTVVGMPMATTSQYVSSRTNLNETAIQPPPPPQPAAPQAAPPTQPLGHTTLAPVTPTSNDPLYNFAKLATAEPATPTPPGIPVVYMFRGSDVDIPKDIIPYVTRTSQPTRQLLIDYNPTTKTVSSRIGSYSEAGNKMEYEAHKTHRLFSQVSPTDRISDSEPFTQVLSLSQQLNKIAFLEDNMKDASAKARMLETLNRLSNEKVEIITGTNIVPDSPHFHQNLKLVLNHLNKGDVLDDSLVVVEFGLSSGWVQEDPKLQTILKDMESINSWNSLCHMVVEQTRAMPPYIWSAMNQHATNAFNDVVQLGLKYYDASLGNFAIDGRTAVEDITNGLANNPEALEWFLNSWAYAWNSACIPQEMGVEGEDEVTGTTVLRTVQCIFLPLMNGTIDLCYPGPVGYVAKDPTDMVYNFLEALHNINPIQIRRLLISKQGSLVKFMKCYDGGFSIATVD